VGKHRRADTETSDFVAMMHRFMIAWGDRVGADPAALVHLPGMMDALVAQTNRGIFEANKGDSRYSQNEIGRFLGITRQGVAKRIGLGERAYAILAEARGGGAVVRLGAVRAERAALMEAAGVADRTGSVRELRAGTERVA
jgi:hypothetical protein